MKKKEHKDIETDELLELIRANILREIAIGEKYGFDVRQHWKDMMEYLDKEEKNEA